MSALGPKRTHQHSVFVSAIRGKADIPIPPHTVAANDPKRTSDTRDTVSKTVLMSSTVKCTAY
jgi:hypothetical protein